MDRHIDCYIVSIIGLIVEILRYENTKESSLVNIQFSTPTPVGIATVEIHFEPTLLVCDICVHTLS